MRGLVAFCVALVMVSPALACPLCESATGRQVRAGIFDGDFGYHLLAVALPFAGTLAAAALVHFGVPWPKRPPPRGPEGR